MSNSGNQTSSNDESVEAAAAAWLVQRDEGFTPEQAAEFARWRNADPSHAAAVAMLEETAAILGKMPLLREQPFKLMPGTAGVSPASEPGSRDTRRRHRQARILRFPAALRTALAIAACVTIAIAVWTLRSARESRDVFQKTYTTVGDYLRVSLPDQSVIQLNADTEVRVQFSARERRVALNRGEAHFTVAKNPDRPFVVGAGRVAVRAVGTAFNVRMAASAVEVLVTEGRVQVGHASATAHGGGTEGFVASDVPVLLAGQRVTLPIVDAPAAAGSPQVTSLDSAAVQSALAWQAPRLVFQETPLLEVVRQFNRHNRVQLVLGDAALGDRPVGGTFRADQVETFVGLLETSRDVAVERPNPETIVLRRVSPAP